MEDFKETLLITLERYYSDIAVLLPQLALGILALLFFWLVNKYVSRLLNKAMSGKLDDPLVGRFIIRIVKVILFALAVLTFMKIIGLGGIAAGIWGTAGIGAFVIGFAFKDIGEHFLAGFILAFSRPFRVGDTVESNGIIGKVKGLNLRDTHIKTFDGKDVYIPNGSVIKNPLINYTIDGFIRKEFTIGIDYIADIDMAVSTLLDVITKHPDVLNDQKKPVVAISKIGTSSLELKSYYWLNTFDTKINTTQVERELIRDCLKALSSKDINLPGDIIELKNYSSDSIRVNNQNQLMS